MATAVALVLIFASGVCWLSGPTVLPNAGLADYKVEKSRPHFLAKADLLANEEAAIRLAEEENTRLGIAKAAPVSGQSASPHAVDDAKPKRVARIPKRPPSEPHASCSTHRKFRPI